MREIPILCAVALAACGGSDVTDAVSVDTYVTAALHHGVDELPGTWHGSLFGESLASPPLTEALRPDVGDCSYRFVDYLEGAADPGDDLLVTIDDLGSWRLVFDEFDGTMRTTEELPEAPFLEPGAMVHVEFGDARESIEAPSLVEILSPDKDAPVDVRTGQQVRWTTEGEVLVQVILVLSDAQYRFLGIQSCLVSNSGSFTMPAWPMVPEGGGRALLVVRAEKSARISAGTTQVDFYVRQQRLRPLTVP